MSSQKTKPATAQNKQPAADDSGMALGMGNYKLMLIGFGIIVLGFILMVGGDSSSPEQFDYSMFSFRRITLAPILVLGGFAFEIYAIMSKGGRKEKK